MTIDYSDAPQPPSPPDKAKAYCVIRLTDEQRFIVSEKTGRDLEEIVVPDDEGKITESMSSLTPDEITAWALIMAEELNNMDRAYHEYLVALAQWEEDKRKAENDENDLALQAEQHALRMKLFFEQEVQAVEQARAMAKKR